METQGNPGVETVTALMLIREMPEAEFTNLCNRLLSGEVSTRDLMQVASPLLERNADNRGHARTSADSRCLVCGGKAEAEPLNIACEASVGFTACKRCIDAALVACFGPEPQANFIVRRVMRRMAADA